MSPLQNSASPYSLTTSVSAGMVGSRWSSLSVFFRYHGVWAPGVRLFRRLSFQAKAAIVSTALLVPLLVLAWFFHAAKQADLDFVHLEREGVAYATPLIRWSHLTLQSAADRSGEQQAWAAVQAAHERHGAALEAGRPYERLLSLVRPGGGIDDGRTEALHQAQAQLLDQVVDRSNLALDPAFASYYVMDAALIAAPDLAQHAGRLRELLVAATRSHRLLTAQLVAMDRESEAVSRRVAQLETSLGKAAQEVPGLRTAVPLAQVQQSARALVALADSVVEGRPHAVGVAQRGA